MENDVKKLVRIFNSGDYFNAIEIAQVFLKNYPKEYFVWNILGISLAKTGRTDEAVKVFKKYSADLNCI